MVHRKVLAFSVGIILLVQGAVGLDNCSQKCHETYQPHTTEFTFGIDRCEKGCRLFLLINGVAKTEDQTDNETLKNCKHSCEDAYTKDPSSIAACQTGCEYQKPSPVNGESPKTEKAPENANDDSFQEIQDAGMPFFTIQLPNILEDLDEFELPKWADKMRKSMDEMHERMMGWVKNSFPEKQFFGADMKHDGIAKFNPLEEFFNPSETEVFDPKITSSDADDKKSGNRVFEIEIIGPYRLDTSRINFKNDYLEEPKLPEEGLKTRADAEYVYLDRVCQRDSKDLSWSDIFSCVHHRMHVPRWFTIATVLLSILFMIWLCFVIPASAPKQKVVSEDSKEKEALSIVSVHLAHATGVPNDLPPSYDEVANLKVQLSPVHQIVIDEKPKATKI